MKIKISPIIPAALKVEEFFLLPSGIATIELRCVALFRVRFAIQQIQIHRNIKEGKGSSPVPSDS